MGRTLSILARSLGARAILEVGTAIGYGAIFLARGAAEARVATIDKDPGMIANARGFLERAVPRLRMDRVGSRRSGS